MCNKIGNIKDFSDQYIYLSLTVGIVGFYLKK